MVDIEEAKRLRANALNLKRQMRCRAKADTDLENSPVTHADIQLAKAEGIILAKHDGAFNKEWQRRQKIRESRQGKPSPHPSIMHDPANVASFKRMWTSEVPIKTICKTFGFSSTQANYWCNKLGLEPRHLFIGKERKTACINVLLVPSLKKQVDTVMVGRFRSYSAYIRYLIKKDLAGSIL